MIKNNSYTNRFIFFSAMTDTLSLHSLLDSDNLTRPNFDSWYQKLKIVLKYERILYVLTDLPPEEPATNAPCTVSDTYLN